MTLPFDAFGIPGNSAGNRVRRAADAGQTRTALMIAVAVLLLGLALADLFPFGISELYRAMWDGDEARALELIGGGAHPNSSWGASHKIETENRAVRLNRLHFALARALPRVAVALMTRERTSKVVMTGATALIVAAHKGMIEVVRALLAKGRRSKCGQP